MKVGKSILIVSGILVSLLALIVIGVFFTGFIFTAIGDTYNSNIDETDDIDIFLTKKYTEYNGGNEAEVFFDEYAIVNEYQDAQFHYKDGKKIISTRSYCTAFVLDIYYEQFPEEIWETPGLNLNSDYHYYNKPFSIYKIDSEKDIYNDNSAFVMIDTQHKTIRYVFVYDSSVTPNEVDETLSHIFELNWNDNMEDWIFDYSDIVE